MHVLDYMSKIHSLYLKLEKNVIFFLIDFYLNIFSVLSLNYFTKIVVGDLFFKISY